MEEILHQLICSLSRIPLFAGFYASHVVQDFFHRQQWAIPDPLSGSLRKPFCVVSTVYMTSHRKCTAVVVFICSSHFCREKKELPRLGVGKKFHAHLANPKNRNACHPSIDCRTKRLSALERATYGGGAKFDARNHDQPTSKPPIPASVDLNCNGVTWRLDPQTPQQMSGDFPSKSFSAFPTKIWGRETSKVGTCCHTQVVKKKV